MAYIPQTGGPAEVAGTTGGRRLGPPIPNRRPERQRGRMRRALRRVLGRKPKDA